MCSGTGGFRPCNTAQEGGEASALGSNGWRVSIVRTGYRLKAHRLGLGALPNRLGYMQRRCSEPESREHEVSD